MLPTLVPTNGLHKTVNVRLIPHLILYNLRNIVTSNFYIRYNEMQALKDEGNFQKKAERDWDE